MSATPAASIEATVIRSSPASQDSVRAMWTVRMSHLSRLPDSAYISNSLSIAPSSKTSLGVAPAIFGYGGLAYAAVSVLAGLGMLLLAVQVYRLASDERLAEAALPAIALVAVGLIPVLILSWRLRRSS